MLISYHPLAQIFEVEGKKHLHITEAALFKKRVNRELACPELKFMEKKRIPGNKNTKINNMVLS